MADVMTGLGRVGVCNNILIVHTLNREGECACRATMDGVIYHYINVLLHVEPCTNLAGLVGHDCVYDWVPLQEVVGY